MCDSSDECLRDFAKQVFAWVITWVVLDIGLIFSSLLVVSINFYLMPMNMCCLLWYLNYNTYIKAGCFVYILHLFCKLQSFLVCFFFLWRELLVLFFNALKKFILLKMSGLYEILVKLSIHKHYRMKRSSTCVQPCCKQYHLILHLWLRSQEHMGFISM